MRWLTAAACCVALWTTHAAATDFPYLAYINGGEVYVRSGPGTNYYPTAKLKRGDVVEVYRHDPGGWLAIRPPQGSFSWALARQLHLTQDGRASAAKPRVAVRVGSTLGDVREVIQVRLDEGEPVEVLQTKGNWCQIAPPAGEFRFIAARDVDHQPLDPDDDAVARESESNLAASSSATPETDAHADAGSDRADPSVKAPIQTVAAFLSDSDDSTAREPADGDAKVEPGWRVAQRKPHKRKDAEMKSSPAAKAAGQAAEVAVPIGLTTADVAARLAAMEIELSQLILEEPTVWSLDSLRERADELAAAASDPLDRGRLRAFLAKLDRLAGLRERHQQLTRGELAVQRHGATGELAAASPSDPRFDGTGRLLPVATRAANSPPYALVDSAGQPLCYLTPSPGVNLATHRDHYVGVYGARGVLADGRTKHIQVQRLVPLDD